MAQTIHRMFDSNARAQEAATELREHRYFSVDDIFVFSGQGPSGTALTVDEIVAAMLKAHILKSDAKALALGVQKGGTLVTVHAAFGTAVEATEILDHHGPIESGLVEFKATPLLWDDAAPLSSMLRMPTHLANTATFSRFWNVPALVKSGGTTNSALGLPEISRSSGAFSGTFPMPLLSHNSTPLSKMLGLPLLKKANATKR